MAAPKLPRVLGVIGAGQMGAGIAQVAATKGLEVVFCDSSEAAIERGFTRISDSLSRLIKKGIITQKEGDEAVDRIKPTKELDAFYDADYVIEAVSENEPLKRAIFQRLDLIAKPDTILASNTSSISITRIAAATQRPDQVIGMHFMNPVPLMPLVEIIRGMGTSDAAYETCRAVSEQLGKTVCVSQDRPGFIVNRILMPMINEAFYALMEGVGSAQDIDKGMKMGTNQPMGPLQLADFIGLDTCLAIMRVLHEGLGDDKYRPCPLLIQYVDAGWLGKKSSRGVFPYDS
eukprot:jgi/Botrbrau1/8906/Bobra.0148s0021.1